MQTHLFFVHPTEFAHCRASPDDTLVVLHQEGGVRRLVVGRYLLQRQRFIFVGAQTVESTFCPRHPEARLVVKQQARDVAQRGVRRSACHMLHLVRQYVVEQHSILGQDADALFVNRLHLLHDASFLGRCDWGETTLLVVFRQQVEGVRAEVATSVFLHHAVEGAVRYLALTIEEDAVIGQDPLAPAGVLVYLINRAFFHAQRTGQHTVLLGVAVIEAHQCAVLQLHPDRMVPLGGKEPASLGRTVFISCHQRQHRLEGGVASVQSIDPLVVVQAPDVVAAVHRHLDDAVTAQRVG